MTLNLNCKLLESDFRPERLETKLDFGTWYWRGSGIQRRSLVQISTAAAAVLEVWTCSMSLCQLFWICCIPNLSNIFCELPPHTVGLKPAKMHILNCDWPLCGLPAAVLLLWSVWHGPSPDQHQHGECADVHGCTYLPLVLCLCKEAGGGGGTMSTG